MSVSSAQASASPASPLTLPVDLEPDNPLWRFALAFWRLPAVEASCLALQARGWSVTRILCGAWLATSGRAFSGTEDATVTEWRERVTGALRNARKTLPGEVFHYQKLRAGIAGMELEAEQIELALAWRTLMTHNPEHVDMQGRDTLIRTNLMAAAPTATLDEHATAQVETLAGALAQLPNGDHQP